jgi:hypothetical protein
MTTNYEPQVGDVMLVRGTAFLSKGIQFFMNIYRKALHQPKYVVYNHAAIVVDVWGKKVVAEAGARGIQAIYTAEDYMAQNKKILVKRYKTALTEEEQKLLSQYACSFMYHPTRYDFLNFLYQIALVMTGKWYGPRRAKATKRLYCSEYVAVVMDGVRATFHAQTWDKNPVDIALCEDLEDVAKNSWQ